MGSVYEGSSEDFCIFYFLSILDTLSIVQWSCDHLVIANIVLIYLYIYIDIYIYLYLMMLLSYFTYLSMCCLFSLFIHMFLI